MQIEEIKISTNGYKILILDDKNTEVARAYLYILFNDIHKKPFIFIEDVFVIERHRGRGFGKKIINYALQTAKAKDCYKIILTSRHSSPGVHKFYQKQGFIDWGKEFRMNIVKN